MPDIRRVFEWARENGEVKAVDRILVKVMLLLIKNRITLTAGSIDKLNGQITLPEEVSRGIIQAAEEVVGRPLPDPLLAKEASHV